MYKGKKSDPNKPKRPMTAYFIFLGDFREKMKNRGVDHKEILRLGIEPFIIVLILNLLQLIFSLVNSFFFCICADKY